MRRNVLIMVAALAVGLLAALASAVYLRGARADIAAQNEPIEVYIAQQDLSQGTSAEELLSKKLVKLEKVPRRFVPEDAISSERAIENQVLAVPVSAGEQLTATRFTYAADAGLAYSVPESLVAISVKVDDVTGVAGLLKPGDSVTVFSSYRVEGDKVRNGAITQTLIPKARVLAVGGTVNAPAAAENGSGGGMLGKGNAEEGGYTSVTLAVSSRDAGRVAFANFSGTVQLALLSQAGGDGVSVPMWSLFKEPVLKSARPVTE